MASLFQAIGALKQISVVLRVSAMFWRQMAEHCKELASSDLKEKVTMFITEPPEQRLVFFLEEDFKVQVVTYLAGWKAVELIAIDYGATCGRVRAQIQEDFKKNPNTEDLAPRADPWGQAARRGERRAWGACDANSGDRDGVG